MVLGFRDLGFRVDYRRMVSGCKGLGGSGFEGLGLKQPRISLCGVPKPLHLSPGGVPCRRLPCAASLGLRRGL